MKDKTWALLTNNVSSLAMRNGANKVFGRVLDIPIGSCVEWCLLSKRCIKYYP